MKTHYMVGECESECYGCKSLANQLQAQSNRIEQLEHAVRWMEYNAIVVSSRLLGIKGMVYELDRYSPASIDEKIRLQACILIDTTKETVKQLRNEK